MKRVQFIIPALLGVVVMAVLLCLNFRYHWGSNGSFSTALNMLIAATAIVGASAVFLQLRRDRTLHETEFLVAFNRNFVEFQVLMKVHDICSGLNGLPVDGRYRDEELVETDVFPYLDCFEPLYFLLKEKTVSIEKMYDLIAYRFFVVVNCRQVQETVIGRRRAAFANLIRMYKLLYDYRLKAQLPPPFEDFEKNDLLRYLRDNPVQD